MADIFDVSRKPCCCCHPHCKTCTCHSHVRSRSKATSLHVNWSPPRPLTVLSRPCICGCRPNLDRELQECEPHHHHCLLNSPSPPPRLRVERTIHSDRKYELLESWFKKFDFDSNGLLDLFELKTMLQFLGLKAKEEYVKEILDKADKDGDGRLMFSEFLLMWRQAQDDDELVQIIREHGLHPDVIKMDYPLKRRPKAEVFETMTHKLGSQPHHRVPKLCTCGDRIQKIYHRHPEEEVFEYDSMTSRKSDDSGKFPILSSYR